MRLRSLLEVDLGAVRNNVQFFRDLIGPSSLCAVVKANAYGHGAADVAAGALSAGAESLAVALVEEAIALRKAGIGAPILLLSEPPPGTMEEVATWGITPTIYSKRAVQEIAQRRLGIGVHVKVDTGMHRVGVAPSQLDRLLSFADKWSVSVEALSTHFADADVDSEFTRRQMDVFDGIVGQYRLPNHLANTAAALRHPESRRAMCRIGIGIYGLSPGAPDILTSLKPVLRWSTKVLRVSSGVAVLPVGFVNGLPRRASGVGHVLVGGKRCAIQQIGMFETVVRTREPVQGGDPVVLLGRQYEACIDVREMADWAGTIPYETLCRLDRPHANRRVALG